MKATPPLLKDLNERTVYETIRTAAPVSRAEISRQAGISKPTVSLALQALVDAGLVRETEPEPGRTRYGAVFFEPVAEAALVLGLDLGARFLRGAICDLSGSVRARQDVELPNVEVENALTAIAKLRTSLVDASNLPGDTIDTVVAGVPGVVEPTGKALAGDERPRPGGAPLRSRARGRARPAGHARQRHQPRGARRTVARCRARRRRLRLPFGRYRPRCRARPPRRAPPRPERSGRRARPRCRRARRRHRPLRRRRNRPHRSTGGRRCRDLADRSLRRALGLRGSARRRRAREARDRRDGQAHRLAHRFARRRHRRRTRRPRRRHRHERRPPARPDSPPLADWLPFPPRVEVSGLGDAAVLTGALAAGLELARERVFANRSSGRAKANVRV